MNDVIDNQDENRFELTIEGRTAELIYELEDRLLVLTHTEVPDELGGHGVGGQLVKAAVQRASREGLTIVPVCPFARKWLQTHPDEIGDVSVQWDDDA